MISELGNYMLLVMLLVLLAGGEKLKQVAEPALLDKVVRGRFAPGNGEFLLKDLSVRADVPIGFEMLAEDYASPRAVTIKTSNARVRDVL